MSIWKNDDTFLARWMADELSADELEAFRQSDEYEQFKAIADTAETFTVPEYDADASFKAWKANKNADKTKAGEPAKPATVTRLKKYAVAATVLIAALAAAWFFIAEPFSTVQHQTAYGERQTISLPGGSEVTLNANSTISYNSESWENERMVTLEGEAFFKVTKGNTFTVQTDLGAVSVLGTKFNVKNRDNFFDAACYEGRVSVAISDTSQTLEAGREIRYRTGAHIQQSAIDTSAAPSWTGGIITLRKVPLKVAIAELEAQFGIETEYQGVSIADSLTFTGSFSSGRPQPAIELVLDPFGLEYDYDADNKKLTIYNN